jgi:hypothetical protein
MRTTYILKRGKKKCFQILRSALARSSVRCSDYSGRNAGQLRTPDGGTCREIDVERLRTTVSLSPEPQAVTRPVQGE